MSAVKIILKLVQQSVLLIIVTAMVNFDYITFATAPNSNLTVCHLFEHIPGDMSLVPVSTAAGLKCYTQGHLYA